MSSINEVTATFNGTMQKVTTAPINYQYDATQVLRIEGLELPDYYMVDFCNENDQESIPITAMGNRVRIPDEYLATGRIVKAYVVITDDESVQTRYEITIPVNRRPARTDIDPTPAEQLQIDELIEAMNDAVEQAEAVAELLDGGDDGQVLTKDSDEDRDFSWKTLPKEIFWAEYGTTTYTEIEAARAADRLVVCLKDGIPFVLASTRGSGFSTEYYFGSNYTYMHATNEPHAIHYLKLFRATGNWSEGYVQIPEAGTTLPLMDGEASAGESNKYSRADHIHPHDDSKYDVKENGIPYADLAQDVKLALQSAITAYQKPSGGIPASDMSSDVQTSLGKADTALQEHQSLAAYRTAAEQDTIDAGKADKTDVGDLDDLETTDKSSLVAAVNEVNGKSGLPAGGTPGDVLQIAGDDEPYWNKITVRMMGWVGTGDSEIEADFNPVIPTADALISNLYYGVTTVLVVNHNQHLRLVSATKTNNLCNFVFTGMLDSGTLAIASFSSVPDSEEYDMTGEYTTVPVGGALPAGGNGDQALFKTDGQDYNVEWRDLPQEIEYVYGTLSNGIVTVTADLFHPFPSLSDMRQRKKLYFLRYGTIELQLVDAYGNQVLGPYTFVFSGVTADDTIATVAFNSVSASATSMSGSLVETTISGGGTSDYSDLTDKPQINGHTLSGNQSAADLGLGTYSEPSGGIPKTDLASDVQTSLGKADTALQSYTETDPTVPSWAKASSKPTYTASEVGAIAAPAAPSANDVLTYKNGMWSAEAPVSAQQIQDAVDEYLDDHPTVTGTFTNAAKYALLALLEKVAYVDDDGQDYWDALQTELFAVAVTSISAVFTQGGAYIYDTDSLDTLRQYLVVTADYSDGTSGTVNLYTLSGTLTVGTSTITVSYGGQTDTFSVTVTAAPLWTFTDGYTCSKSTAGATKNNIYKQATQARAVGAAPIENHGYVFTVTDSAKYNLAAYDVTSLTHTTNVPSAAIEGFGYVGSTKSIAWTTSDSVSTAYVWLALKKMDGTAFTDAELANGAAAVFTVSSSS